MPSSKWIGTCSRISCGPNIISMPPAAVPITMKPYFTLSKPVTFRAMPTAYTDWLAIGMRTSTYCV